MTSPDGNATTKRPDRIARFCRDDRERRLALAVESVPVLVQPREEPQLVIERVDPVRLALPYRARPLVEPAGRHEASPRLEGIPVRRAVMDRLGAGVDLLRGPLIVLRPKVHQPPTAVVENAALPICPDNPRALHRAVLYRCR
jgi:hypothetical protein